MLKGRYFCVATGVFATGIVFFGCPFYLFWITFAVMALLGAGFVIKSRKVYFIILALMFLVGGMYGNYTENCYKTSALYEYTQKPCSGKFLVTEIDARYENSVRVRAKVIQIEDKKVSEPILFTIYNLSDVKVNTIVEFSELKFKIPDGARNRGGFDYNRYLKSKGIYFTAAATREDLSAKGEGGFLLFKYCRALKQQIDYRCANVFGKSNAAQMMPALLVGNDVSLSDQINDLFSMAGITHILVASGMHVAVVLIICSILLYPFRKNRYLYNIITSVVVLLFAIIVGLHPSIIRAVVAYFMYLIARNTLRCADSVTVLFEAMFVILLINPLSIYNLSFLLSFGSVFGIITLSPHIIKWLTCFVYTPNMIVRFVNLFPKSAGEWITNTSKYITRMAVSAAAVSIAAQIGVFPIMVKAFNGSAIMSLFINVGISLLIPFVYILGIAALITGLEPYVTLAKCMCDILVKGAEITAKIPGNIMSFASSNLITVGCTLLAISVFLRCKVKNFKKWFDISVAICCVMVLTGACVSFYIPKDKVMVEFLNVEQGDCVVIRTKDKAVMIDTGTQSMCSLEVVSYLKREGIEKLDALILSHSDSDHSGGAELLNSSVKIEEVFTNIWFDPNLDGVKRTIVKSGDEFCVGDACFLVLSPDKEANFSSDNDSSLVIRMDFGESSFLFTGDAGSDIENNLENVDVDVLKVSHHGAKSASTEEFLKKVSPEFSVISVDKDNSYGHPDKDVLKRLEGLSGEVLRTDRDYTITFMADKTGEISLTKGL